MRAKAFQVPRITFRGDLVDPWRGPSAFTRRRRRRTDVPSSKRHLNRQEHNLFERLRVMMELALRVTGSVSEPPGEIGGNTTGRLPAFARALQPRVAEGVSRHQQMKFVVSPLRPQPSTGRLRGASLGIYPDYLRDRDGASLLKVRGEPPDRGVDERGIRKANLAIAGDHLGVREAASKVVDAPGSATESDRSATPWPRREPGDAGRSPPFSRP